MKYFSFLSVAVAVCCVLPLSAQAESISFANFGAYVATPLTPGDAVGIQTEGPYAWSSDPALLSKALDSLPPLPGWDATARWEITPDFLGPYVQDPLGVFTAPIASASTLTAYDGDGAVLGTIALEGLGAFSIDARPENAIVDSVSGLVLRKFGNTVSGFDTPVENLTVVGTTGIYEDLVQVGDWELYAAGVHLLWLDPSKTLEEILVDDNFSLGATTPFVLTGSYEMVPEPSSLILHLTALGGFLVIRRRS